MTATALPVDRHGRDEAVAPMPKWARMLRLLAPGLIVGYSALCVLMLRNLHADGSWAFLHGLLEEGYWVGDPYRIVADLAAQTPFAVLVHAGVSDTSILLLAHGVGVLLIPGLAWAWALLLLRRSAAFDFVLLGYCVTSLSTGFLAVGSYNYLFAFTALAFAAIVQYFATGRSWLAWTALACTVIVAVSHGLALLLAPFLIAEIALLWRRVGRPDKGRSALVASIVVLIGGTLLSALSIVRPYSPGNVLAAANMSTPIAQNHQLQFVIAWLALLLFATLLRSRRVRSVVAALMGLGMVVFVASPGLWATPWQQHASRTWSSLLLFLVLGMGLGVLLVQARHAEVSEGGWRSRPALAGLTFSLFVAFLVPAVVQTLQFGAFVRDFRDVVLSGTGSIANDDFVERVPAAERYGWPWTYPIMSMVLGVGKEHATVANPDETVWVPPFDPAAAPEIPSRFTG